MYTQCETNQLLHGSVTIKEIRICIVSGIASRETICWENIMNFRDYARCELCSFDFEG